MKWVKSSYSYTEANCLEVAELPDGDIGLRDSKDPDGPVLRFTGEEWRAFLRAVTSGHLAAPPPVTGTLIEARQPGGRGNRLALSRLILQ